jgi:hypothetical protein
MKSLDQILLHASINLIKMPAQILLQCLVQLYLILIQREAPRNYGDKLILLQTDQILTHMYIVLLQGEAADCI